MGARGPFLLFGVGQPAETLTAIYDAARSATHEVTGAHAPDRQPARWRPHITICYSTSSQPAKPIIDALGTRLPGCDIDINALSLVIQHGPERAWDWSIVSTIRLRGIQHEPSPAIGVAWSTARPEVTLGLLGGGHLLAQLP